MECSVHLSNLRYFIHLNQCHVLCHVFGWMQASHGDSMIRTSVLPTDSGLFALRQRKEKGCDGEPRGSSPGGRVRGLFLWYVEWKTHDHHPSVAVTESVQHIGVKLGS